MSETLVVDDPFNPNLVSFSVERTHRALVDHLLQVTASEGKGASSGSSESPLRSVSLTGSSSSSSIEDQFAIALRTILGAAPYHEPSLAEHKEAIRRCAAYSSRVDEKLIKGYIVVSINEWGLEQERVLLITDKAYYRMKYVYETQSVERSVRMPFQNIVRVEYGTFRPAKYSLTGYLIKEKLYMQSGFRVVTNTKDGNSSINDVVREAMDGNPQEYRRTYRPFTADQLTEKAVVEEIASLMMVLSRLNNPADSGQYIFGQSLFRVLYEGMEMEIPGGFISWSYNALQAGTWNNVDHS